MVAVLQKPVSLANGKEAMHDYIELIRTQGLHRKAEQPKAETEEELLRVQQTYREQKGYGG